SWFRHQAAYAVKRSLGPEIQYGAIAREWVPNGSVERRLNSKSRISRRTSTNGSLRDHIRYRWNNPSSSAGPASFFGVEATDKFTTAGFRIYRWNPDILARRRELESWLPM